MCCIYVSAAFFIDMFLCLSQHCGTYHVCICLQEEAEIFRCVAKKMKIKNYFLFPLRVLANANQHSFFCPMKKICIVLSLKKC